MHKRPDFTGHTPYPLPLGQRLLNGDMIALQLSLGCGLGIERLEEIGYQRTDRQQLRLTFISIDMSLRLEVDILVLFIQSGVRE